MFCKPNQPTAQPSIWHSLSAIPNWQNQPKAGPKQPPLTMVKRKFTIVHSISTRLWEICEAEFTALMLPDSIATEAMLPELKKRAMPDVPSMETIWNSPYWLSIMTRTPNSSHRPEAMPIIWMKPARYSSKDFTPQTRSYSNRLKTVIWLSDYRMPTVVIRTGPVSKTSPSNTLEKTQEAATSACSV